MQGRNQGRHGERLDKRDAVLAAEHVETVPRRPRQIALREKGRGRLGQDVGRRVELGRQLARGDREPLPGRTQPLALFVAQRRLVDGLRAEQVTSTIDLAQQDEALDELEPALERQQVGLHLREQCARLVWLLEVEQGGGPIEPAPGNPSEHAGRVSRVCFGQRHRLLLDIREDGGSLLVAAAVE